MAARSKLFSIFTNYGLATFATTAATIILLDSKTPTSSSVLFHSNYLFLWKQPFVSSIFIHCTYAHTHSLLLQPQMKKMMMIAALVRTSSAHSTVQQNGLVLHQFLLLHSAAHGKRRLRVLLWPLCSVYITLLLFLALQHSTVTLHISLLQLQLWNVRNFVPGFWIDFAVPLFPPLTVTFNILRCGSICNDRETSKPIRQGHCGQSRNNKLNNWRR